MRTKLCPSVEKNQSVLSHSNLTQSQLHPVIVVPRHYVFHEAWSSLIGIVIEQQPNSHLVDRNFEKVSGIIWSATTSTCRCNDCAH